MPCDGDSPLRLTVRGEIDRATVGELQSRLRTAEGKRPVFILVDLAACDFVDASGWRTLVAAAERAKRAGRRFAIANPSWSVHRVLTLTGIDRSVEVIFE